MTSRERWNRRHSEAIAERRVDLSPSDWVLSHDDLLASVPRGRALDVACGLGRHSLHLAELGFAVEALDISDVAVEHTAQVAAARGLPVRARVADLAAEPLPPGPYDVVVDTLFLERRVLGALPAVLAPGGLLLFEAFVAGDGPPGRHELRPGELRDAAAGLDILEYGEGPPVPGGRARVRMVARRPLADSVART